jgi:hypothetical protein
MESFVIYHFFLRIACNFWKQMSTRDTDGSCSKTDLVHHIVIPRLNLCDGSTCGVLNRHHVLERFLVVNKVD